ncbi:hypothetical protein ACF3NT_08570 [Naumannella halotolerans]|uniref:hypothetical protein n=1 Tax=Naumannella halotolerans TaxID=993414 RepID=UPI00370D5BC8
MVSTTQRGTLEEILVDGAAERRSVVTGVWPLGPSTVTVEVVPEGVGGQVADPVSVQTQVWSIPWAWLAVLLLIIGLAVFIGWRRGVRRAQQADFYDDDFDPIDQDHEARAHS